MVAACAYAAAEPSNARVMSVMNPAAYDVSTLLQIQSSFRGGVMKIDRSAMAPFGNPGVAKLAALTTPRILFDSVDLDDIRVVQARQHLRFALEALHAGSILREGGRQHFDGHVAIQLGVGGAVDGAHAAFAELGGDAVMRDGVLRTRAPILLQPTGAARWK